jgi:hypothetical protein
VSWNLRTLGGSSKGCRALFIKVYLDDHRLHKYIVSLDLALPESWLYLLDGACDATLVAENRPIHVFIPAILKTSSGRCGNSAIPKKNLVLPAK